MGGLDKPTVESHASADMTDEMTQAHNLAAGIRLSSVVFCYLLETTNDQWSHPSFGV